MSLPIPALSATPATALPAHSANNTYYLMTLIPSTVFCLLLPLFLAEIILTSHPVSSEREARHFTTIFNQAVSRLKRLKDAEKYALELGHPRLLSEHC